MADEPETVVPENSETDSVETDVSVYEAKISELNGVIAELGTTITALTADLTAAKAANYDLLMTPPGTAEPDSVESVGEDDSDTDIDDLFEDPNTSEDD